MTQVIGTDENNDWFLGQDSHLAIFTELAAVIQLCEQIITIRKGELVRDINRGILSFDQNGVFGNSPNLIEFEFKSRIALESVPDVEDVPNFDVRFINNTIIYEATIKTIYGTAPISGTI